MSHLPSQDLALYNKPTSVSPHPVHSHSIAEHWTIPLPGTFHPSPAPPSDRRDCSELVQPEMWFSFPFIPAPHTLPRAALLLACHCSVENFPHVNASVLAWLAVLMLCRVRWLWCPGAMGSLNIGCAPQAGNRPRETGIIALQNHLTGDLWLWHHGFKKS